MDNQIQSFLQNNQKNLIEIYVKERDTRGDGILHIVKNVEKGKIDVVYLQMNQIPEKLEEEIKERKEKCTKENVIYFYVCSSKDNATLLEIELSKE